MIIGRFNSPNIRLIFITTKPNSKRADINNHPNVSNRTARVFKRLGASL